MKVLSNLMKKQFSPMELDATRNHIAIDRETISKAMQELWDLGTIKNFPEIVQEAFCTKIYIGHDWIIECYNDYIQLKEDKAISIVLPIIPYGTIKRIAFDMYIDKSSLDSIQIILLNEDAIIIPSIK